MSDNSETDWHGFDEVAITKAEDDLQHFIQYKEQMVKGYNVDSNIPPFGVKLNVSNNINSGTKSTVSVMKSRIPRKCQLTTNSKLNKASRNKIVTIKRKKCFPFKSDVVDTSYKQMEQGTKSIESEHDLAHSLLYEPFKLGWRRELVKCGYTGERYVNVYYHTPNDKKLKTPQEVAKYLRITGEPLSVQNFTFCKKPLKFLDESQQYITSPESVIIKKKKITSQNQTPVTIRYRKQLNAVPSINGSSKKVLNKFYKRTREKLLADERYYNDDEVDASSIATDEFRNNNSNDRSGGNLTTNSKISKNKLDKKKEPSARIKNNKNHENEEFEVGMLPPEWIPTDKASTSGSSATVCSGVISSKSNEREVCPITCKLASGFEPNLQCSSCICLFHYECLGLNQNEPVTNFVCKNCQEKCQASSSKSASSDAVYSESNVPVIASAITVASSAASLPSKSMKIIDGVTTWLAPSSSIRISSASDGNSSLNSHLSSSSTNANDIGQEVVEIGGKRYIAVRKHSVMSVVSNSSSDCSANTRSEKSTSSSRDKEQQQKDGDEIGSSSKPNDNNGRVIDFKTLNEKNSQANTTGVFIIPCSHLVSTSTRQIDSSAENGDDAHHHRLQPVVQKSGTPGLKHCPPSCDVQPPLPESNYGRSGDENRNPAIPATLEDTGVVLIQALSYLKVNELLRVARANKFFNKAAMDPSLWSVVKLKNCRVYDWEACINTLCKQNTKRLDLRRMLLPSKPERLSAMWESLLKAMSRMSRLEEIDVCRCDADILNRMAAACPTLRVFNAPFTNSRTIGFRNISELTQLKELVVKGINCERIERFELNANYENMTTLSLTNIANLEPSTIAAIENMKNLEYLALGECTDLFADRTFYDGLKQLTNLKVLRLETIKGIHPDYEIFSVIGQLPHLTSLELINIEVADGFDVKFPQCTNIKQLLLLPVYVSQIMLQAAATNRFVINGLKGIASTLNYLVWGLTTDLFRITNMFIEKQSQDPNSPYGRLTNNVAGINSGGGGGNSKKQVQEIIPVLRLATAEDEVSGNQVSQIAILTCQKLERVVRALLPNTRVKISKVPASSATRPNLISL